MPNTQSYKQLVEEVSQKIRTMPVGGRPHLAH